MTADETFLETLRIRAVLERYCYLLDGGEVDQLLELFTEDCVFTMMGQTYEGKAQFAGVWAGVQAVPRPTTLHALVNPRIEVDGAQATATSSFVFVNRNVEGATQVPFAGRYLDALSRGADGCWRLNQRRVETLARPVPA